MKALFLAAAALAAAVSASAQTIEMLIDSPWAVWDTTATHSVSVQPLRLNATTGALEAISGQRVTLGALSFRSLEIRATFPGLKTSAMAVAGVRLFHQASGAGWAMPEHQVNVTFPAPIVVPAGRPLGCTYSMPLTSKGKLTCAVDTTVVSGIIAPAAAPPPAPEPAPTITAAPAPAGAVISALRVVRVDTAGTVLFQLVDGLTIDLATLPTRNVSVEALASSPNGIGKVEFQIDGALVNTELNPPYALCGDWKPCPQFTAPGQHTLVATPFDGASAAGAPATIRYTIK